MFHRVLVPLDGSPLAEAVLPYITDMAKRFNAQVVLVRVVPLIGQVAALQVSAETPASAPADVAALNQALVDEVAGAETYLDQVAVDLRARGVDVAWEVRRGAPAEEVIASARERKADLIAISTHGRSGLGRLVFGSVADSVMRTSHLPVLLIRPEKVPGKSQS